MPKPTESDIQMAGNAISRAAERFASDLRQRDTSAATISTVEWLWWIVLLDEQLRHLSKEHRQQSKHMGLDELLNGLRHARNMASHGAPANAELIDFSLYPGPTTYPGIETYPSDLIEVHWVSFEDLGAADKRFRNPRNESAFKSQLAGKDVKNVLSSAANWLIDRAQARAR